MPNVFAMGFSFGMACFAIIQGEFDLAVILTLIGLLNVPFIFVWSR